MQQNYSKKIEPIQKTSKNTASSVLDTSSQSEALQRKADMASNAAQREEAPRPNNTGMPDNLKSGIENLSGFSMDDVRVHYNSSKPATVQALAYTQGTDIHVAPGQEKCLPHEAWHVAQQMAGRVSPTTNVNGMLVNDNANLEHEADVMGEKAVQCKMVGEKSFESKENYDNVIQCLNHPAFFKTENDEGCPYSRYYVFTNRYVRIAPINTRRCPTQEYHEENRNFVYVESEDACDFLENHPEIMEKIKKTEHTEEILTLIQKTEFDSPEELISFLGKHKNVISKISRIPKNGFYPYDWNSIPFGHLGHKIEDKLELYTDDKSLEKELNEREKNLGKYKARRKYARDFLLRRPSEEEPTTLDEEYRAYKTACIDAKISPFNFEDWFIYRKETHFTNLWNSAVKLAEAEGRRLFSREIFNQLLAHDGIAFEYFNHLPKFTSDSGSEVIDEDLASSTPKTHTH